MNFRIETCNACNSEIRLPEDVKETAKIQCPICQAKFRLSDLLGPPVATIIDDDEDDEDPESPTGEIASVPHVDRVVENIGAEQVTMDAIIPAPSYEKTTARGRARAQGVQIKPEVSRRAGSKSSSKSSSSKTKKTFTKRNKKSEFLRFVFGAFLAIPVAQLVLWWFFAKDPLALAPTVSNYAPFLVPAKVLPAEERIVESEEPRNDPDTPPNFRAVERDEMLDSRPKEQILNEQNKKSNN